MYLETCTLYLETCTPFSATFRKSKFLHEQLAELDRPAVELQPDPPFVGATALAEDPNRTFSMEEHGEAVAVMRTFPVRRAEFVDAWLAESHCPARWAASEGRR